MSECDRWREQANAYVAGMLDDDERAQLEDHVIGCPACREELETARRTWSSLDHWLDARTPAGLAERALDRHRARGRLLRILWPTAAAAVIALGLFVWSSYRPQTGVAPAPTLPRTPQAPLIADADREIIEVLDLLEEMPMLAELHLVQSADMLQTLDRLGLVDGHDEEEKS